MLFIYTLSVCVYFTLMSSVVATLPSLLEGTDSQGLPAQPADNLLTHNALPAHLPVSRYKRQTKSRKEKFDRICHANSQLCFSTVRTVFGQFTKDLCSTVKETSEGPFVNNGEDAKPREFPHMARIGHEERTPHEVQTINWVCGGSLISRYYVLTAAHCAYTAKSIAKWVRLGEYDWNVPDTESNSVDYRVKEIRVHEAYKVNKYNDDIALIKLDRAVKLTHDIRPVCLNTENNRSDRTATAAGWGVDTMTNLGYDTIWGSINKSILQKVDLDILSDADCHRALRKYQRQGKLSQRVNFASMMCAGSPGRDTCSGDSGGPLGLKLTSPANSHLLLGITAFGDNKHCTSQEPGVYMRVSYYLPMIERIVRNNWQEPPLF